MLIILWDSYYKIFIIQYFYHYRLRGEQAVEDSSALYSTVRKIYHWVCKDVFVFIKECWAFLVNGLLENWEWRRNFPWQLGFNLFDMYSVEHFKCIHICAWMWFQHRFVCMHCLWMTHCPDQCMSTCTLLLPSFSNAIIQMHYSSVSMHWWLFYVSINSKRFFIYRGFVYFLRTWLIYQCFHSHNNLTGMHWYILFNEKKNFNKYFLRA